MACSRWVCINNSRSMFVKIVHRGGHVELHDRPILAAEILLRNPKCCVAHPNVFKQPWAIVAPDTTLLPGQKFYVVPIGTIRKLQRHSSTYSSSLISQEIQTSQIGKVEEGEGDSTCWLFIATNSPKLCSPCLKQTENEGEKAKMEKLNGHCLEDNCFPCLPKAMNKIKTSTEDSSKDSRLISGSLGSSETRVGTRKRIKVVNTKGFPNRLACFDQSWRPSLVSISEE
ncbi:unnamed protein product [Ilex paraguariensis]|uniref:Uncharacterized protein n=1 Tax=Ilex paraguariensis TaxID=185542 RepID=A0ABC8S375_9AQUA